MRKSKNQGLRRPNPEGSYLKPQASSLKPLFLASSLRPQASSLFFLAFCLLPFRILAHEPITTKVTWSKEVVRILGKHCLSCHSAGSVAMSLASYAEARPWAKAIKEEVLERRMPPWFAAKGFGDFSNDRSLTPLEMDLLAAWADGGAPKGDDRDLPAEETGATSREPEAGNEREARGVRHRQVSCGPTEVEEPIEVLAVRPAMAPAGGEMEILARLPDGTIEALGLFRNYQPSYPLTYRYRRPAPLPKGTRLELRTTGETCLADFEYVR